MGGLKGPCPSCTSSDGFHLYDDGHGYCFVCEHYEKSPDSPFPVTGTKTTASTELLRIDYDAWGTTGHERGITAETAREMGVGWVEYRGDLAKAYTYYDVDGQACAQKIRCRGKEFVWVGDPKRAVMFGQQKFSPGKIAVTVTEGEEDQLAAYQANGRKYPVVSVKNGAGGAVRDCQAQLEWLSGFSSTVLLFDGDEPGQKAAKACSTTIVEGGGSAKIARIDGFKDASEALVNGKPSKIQEAFWNAQSCRPDGIISGPALREHYCRKIPVGLSVPHAGLQEKTRGMRPRDIWLFTAAPGAGKSTLCREFSVHFAQEHGCRIGYVGLEESVQRGLLAVTSIRDNERQHLDEGFDTAAAYDKHGAFLEKHFVFYDHHGADGRENLVSKLRYLAVAEECDFLVLDHISIALTNEEDERKAVDKLMNQLIQVTQGTEVRIMAIVHVKRTDGKDYAHGAEIGLSALRGSTSLEGVPMTIVAAERNTQAKEVEDRNLVLIRCLKCRETGDTGVAGYMQFNPTTGRLLECAAPVDTEESPF